jgi:hypothetical protein
MWAKRRFTTRQGEAGERGRLCWDVGNQHILSFSDRLVFRLSGGFGVWLESDRRD